MTQCLRSVNHEQFPIQMTTTAAQQVAAIPRRVRFSTEILLKRERQLEIQREQRRRRRQLEIAEHRKHRLAQRRQLGEIFSNNYN